MSLKVTKKTNQVKDLNINHRKEDHFWYGYKALDNDFREIIDCRFYCTNGGTVYCCIWVHGVNGCFNASAQAGGYGYEKKSASLSCALSNAGIHLNESIHSTGRVKETLEAVAKWASGKRNIHIIECYG